MSSALAIHERVDAGVLERVVIQGDLAELSAEDRVAYYRATCESLGLNPFTKPFDYIKLNGKLTLYATRGCTDQLRDIRRVDIIDLKRELTPEMCSYTATGQLPNGRRDTATGIVWIKGLSGELYANAIMKAETKAKRRLTLAICGLGWMDETEAETVREARRAPREYVQELIDAGVVDRSAADVGADLPDGDYRIARESTPQQMRYLFAIAREKGWHEDDVKGCCWEMCGGRKLDEISRSELSALIERVQSGPKWIDPRQRPLDLEAGEDAAAVEISGQVMSQEAADAPGPVPDDPELQAIGRDADRMYFTGQLDRATTTAEVNAVWKRAIEAHLRDDAELYARYEARLREVKSNGNGH